MALGSHPTISNDEKREIINSWQETELHDELKALFEKMNIGSRVIKTHGNHERGKDLVIISQDALSTTARAVVVKKGKLTADAGGSFPVIKDQINMSFQHPFESGEEEVAVTEVLVVMTGTISDEAQRRIKEELKKQAIMFYDIHRLIELFDSYYPKVFLGGIEGEYIDQMIGKLEQSHIFADKKYSLSDCFVSPKIIKTQLSKDPLKSPAGLARNKQILYEAFLGSIKKSSRFIVVGEAGCGKSTFLKKVVIDKVFDVRKANAGRKKQQISEIPVYVEAKTLLPEYKNDDSKLELLIRKIIEMPDSLNIGLLCLDGLDEVNPKDRKKILEGALEFANEKSIGIVATSRLVNYSESQFASWDNYELGSMGIKSAIAFCDMMIEDQDVALMLHYRMDDFSRSFALTPLSLYLLVDVAERRKEIPASLTELYDLYTDEVLGARDQSKGIEILFEANRKRRFLSELAYKELVCKDRASMSYTEFDEMGSKYYENHDWPFGNWQDLLNELIRSSILIINPAEDFVTFRHKSFTEFFAACYLNSAVREDAALFDEVVKCYFDPVWSEVAFYYFGLLREVSQGPVDAILDYDSASPFAVLSKMRVGRLMQASWDSKKEVKKTSISRSSMYAIDAENAITQAFKDNGEDAPILGTDLFLMSISTEAYRSEFVKNQIVDILREEYEPNERAVYSKACLLLGVSDLLSAEEQAEFAKKVLSAAKSTGNSILEGRCLLFSLFATNKDREFNKAINRRAKSFFRNHQGALKALLPS